MKVSRFGKVGAGLAAGVSLSLCLGVVAANAAGTPVTANQEDPQLTAIGTYTLVGVGSDTIQDVEYGVSKDLGTYDGKSLNLASWTATGTTPLKYRSGGTATAHPNGSGAGYTALKESLGMVPLGGTDGIAAGDVDYSRASGFQDPLTEKGKGIGVVTEIPFAVDAISFAAPAGSPFLKTNDGKGLTLEDLGNIYSETDKYIDTVTGELLASAADAGNPSDAVEPIQAFLPKAGSGSRQFFLAQLAKVNSGVANSVGSDKGDSAYTIAYAGTDKPYVGAQMPNGSPVQEHDASVLAAAPAAVAAIAPFSAAKYIGYHNGVIADPSGTTAGTDYDLVPFDNGSTGVLPYTGDASTTATLAPNADYKTAAGSPAAITREVFNIIPTAAVNNPNANVKYRALYDTFVGAGSKFCLDTKAILAYGFLTDSNCGSVARTAGERSSATVSVSHTAAVAGKSTVVTVGVQSNGKAGGALRITINGKAYTATLAKGQTSAKFTVATPKAGSISYGTGSNDGFTPNLSGINWAPAPKGSFTVAKATASVKGSAARVSHTTGGKALVTVSATGVTPTGKVTVTIKKGTSTKATRIVSLSGGKATATLPKLAAGTYYVYASYAGDSNVNKTASIHIANLSVY